jgi:hypothetical protein
VRLVLKAAQEDKAVAGLGGHRKDGSLWKAAGGAHDPLDGSAIRLPSVEGLSKPGWLDEQTPAVALVVSLEVGVLEHMRRD